MRAVNSGVEVLARSSKTRVRRIALSLDNRLRRKSHYDSGHILDRSDLDGVPEALQLANQRALALLNCLHIAAPRSVLDVANLVIENLPHDPEKAMSEPGSGLIWAAAPDESVPKRV